MVTQQHCHLWKMCALCLLAGAQTAHAAAISVSLIPQPTTIFSGLVPAPAFKESTSTKIADSITLKINRDLFEKGLEVQTDGYGQYFATLESSQHLDAKFLTAPAATVLQRKLRQSKMNTGMKVGGFVTDNSKIYVKVDYQSENFAPPNTLKTKMLTGSNQGYWSSALASGVGFEYGFSNAWSIRGEASTAALKNPLAKLSSGATSVATPGDKPKNKRDNRVLVGLSYHFGG